MHHEVYGTAEVRQQSPILLLLLTYISMCIESHPYLMCDIQSRIIHSYEVYNKALCLD